MRVLFIGGTGLISSACADLAAARGHALTLLTRGNAPKLPLPAGVETLRADVRDRRAVEAALAGRVFDAVVNWVAFTVAHVEQDVEVFGGRCGQYVFISSASAYEKPASRLPVTEETPTRGR